MNLTKIFLVCVLLGVASIALAQVAGDYRTTASGNWSTLATWQTYNGSAWVAAAAVPGATNSVYVQNGHTVTLTQAESCKDLHINTANNAKVALASYALSLNGKLRWYSGAVGTIPGTSQTTSATAPLTCTSSSGILKVVGGSRNLTETGQWGVGTYTGSTTLFNMEISADSGATVTMNTMLRAQYWNINTGTLNIGNFSVMADNGTVASGNILVSANATVINSNTGTDSMFKRNASTRGGTLTMNGLLKVMTLAASGTARIAMSTINMNGTVEYAANGAQNTLGTGGDGSTNPTTFNNIILSGSGIKTLANNTTINGKLTIKGTATLALSTFTRTWGAASTLEYNGSSSQTTSNAEWPATSGPTNVIINNSSGVTLNGAKAITGDLTLSSGTLAKGANALDVDGVTYMYGGSTTGTAGYTDGYDDAANYIVIAANNSNITSFALTMTTPSLLPLWVDREWAITGTYSGTKNITFYWTDVDDGGFDWTGKTPAVWIGAKKYLGAYNLSGATNYITVAVDANFTKGNYRIGQDSFDGTLPVELSSFTVTQTQQNFAKLQWITQSETNVAGFFLFRNTDNDLNSAIQIGNIIPATNSSYTTTYNYIDDSVEIDTYYYWLQNVDLNGDSEYHGPLTISLTEQEDPTPDIPVISGLQKIYPNPFNPNTTVVFTIVKDSNVRINIYNNKGQMVRALVDGYYDANTYSNNWDGKDDNGEPCVSGIYMVRMTAGNQVYTRKIALMK